MKQRKCHVLVIPSWFPTPEKPLNGIFFKEQAQALKKAGFKVGVVYSERKSLRILSLRGILQNHFQLRYVEEEGNPTYRIHGWNIPRIKVGHHLHLYLTQRLIDLYIKEFGKPDILHAHSVLWGGVVAMRARHRYGIPYVVTEHSSAYARALIQAWQKVYISNTLVHASAVLAVSSGLKKQLSHYVSEKEIDVVPNLVNTNFFTLPICLRMEYPFRFLTVAFLTPNKGIDLLIRAFARAFKGYPEVYLEIGGDGPQRKELETLAFKLGVTDRVMFLGTLTREAVRQAMWRANAFVLPSHFETFGVVLIEAMATGLPVIATRSGGPEDFVNSNMGCLIEPGSINDLVSALSFVHGSWKIFDPTKIRQHVVDHYSEVAVIEALMKLYKRVIVDGNYDWARK